MSHVEYYALKSRSQIAHIAHTSLTHRSHRSQMVLTGPPASCLRRCPHAAPSALHSCTLGFGTTVGGRHAFCLHGFGRRVRRRVSRAARWCSMFDRGGGGLRRRCGGNRRRFGRVWPWRIGPGLHRRQRDARAVKKTATRCDLMAPRRRSFRSASSTVTIMCPLPLLTNLLL